MSLPNAHRLIFVIFADGERYPVLLQANGLPYWYPTLFATVRYRNASNTPKTTYAALNAIRQVHRWADTESVDLQDRFRRRDFLADYEISSLAAFLRRKSEQKSSAKPAAVPRNPSLGQLEHARARKATAGRSVSSAFAYTRITYAIEYLDWLARRVVTDAALSVDDETSDRIKLMATALRQLRPKGSREKGLNAKQAQPIAEEEHFLDLAEPEHPDNPFSEATAVRNKVIILLLNELGIRPGELLGLETSDFDFASQEVVIERRHNDPNDPRPNQPVAKTDDRRLPMSDGLARLVLDYITKHRRKVPRARLHSRLLISTRGSRTGKAGDPLSPQGLAKVVTALSRKMPVGSEHVHPHLQRHNAATRMARSMYARGVSEPEIEMTLNAKFGWAHGSGTARTYIDREIKSLAAKAQRAMQTEWAQRGGTSSRKDRK